MVHVAPVLKEVVGRWLRMHPRESSLRHPAIRRELVRLINRRNSQESQRTRVRLCCSEFLRARRQPVLSAYARNLLFDCGFRLVRPKYPSPKVDEIKIEVAGLRGRANTPPALARGDSLPADES